MFNKFNKQILILLASLCITSNTYGMTLAEYISQYNAPQANLIAQQIQESSQRYHIDPLLAAAVFKIESNYHNEAISSAGAIGIAQLMPETAKEIGVNPHNLNQNIDGGIFYLKKMANMHRNKGKYMYNYALASYNAGYGNTITGIPSYTYDYINTINQEYLRLKHEIHMDQNILISSPTLEKKKKLLRLYQLKKNVISTKKLY